MTNNSSAQNVLGTPLVACSCQPMTGFYRDGYCRTGGQDYGSHVVCAVMTEDFLRFTKAQGNDLSTPKPELQHFPGLKPGDRWCLCAARWQEAFEVGQAPQVCLEATHVRALEVINLKDLQRHCAIE
ncbi:MAG: DUF2237 domain-containing protein [Synechococcaceae cyanobacterium RL_1_2]|nr:DUF2237 domain-containing protein [Synechococcaceae cyanobacterium RL_1_2]